MHSKAMISYVACVPKLIIKLLKLSCFCRKVLSCNVFGIALSSFCIIRYCTVVHKPSASGEMGRNEP